MEETTLKILLKNKIEKCLEHANTMFPNDRISFNEIEIKYNKGTTAGKANFRKMELFFNLALFEKNILEFDSTIYHEIAHLFQRKLYGLNVKSHGLEWSFVMEKLGQKPERCHTFDTQEVKRKTTRYQYKCPNCGRIYNVGGQIHNKITNGTSHYTCNSDKGIIFFTGNTILK